MDRKNKKELEKQLLTLFIFAMKYNKKLSPMLSSYKLYKDELLFEIDKIYKKYTKDGELIVTSSYLNKELKKLSDKILKVSRELYKEEKEIIPIILSLACDKTYKQTYNILNMDIKDLKDMNKGVKDSIIYKKIKGKTSVDRAKDNKTIFYHKLTRDIKNPFKELKTIEDIKETIEKRFISEEKVSRKLINNEIARIFNDTTRMIYEKEGVKKVEWIATLEKNTCSECASLDGQVFNLEDSPVPILSTHVSCHCILVPYIE